MGLGSFVDINIFVMKYFSFSFLIFSILFESLKSKSTQMLRPQKGSSRVSFNDTLLNFGLRELALFIFNRPVNFFQNMTPSSVYYPRGNLV